MYIALASKRARSRVETVVGRALPWLCAFGPSRNNACTSLTAEEWAMVQQHLQARQWPGITVCTACAVARGPAPAPQLDLF